MFLIFLTIKFCSLQAGSTNPLRASRPAGPQIKFILSRVQATNNSNYRGYCPTMNKKKTIIFKQYAAIYNMYKNDMIWVDRVMHGTMKQITT